MDSFTKNQIRNVLERIYQNGLTWKPGKDVYHLNKRKSRAHIPEDWQLNDYITHIMNILTDKENDIYIYSKQAFNQNYLVFTDGSEWIVIIGEDGIMETAMIADRYTGYLNPSKGYKYVGKIWEVFIK